MASQYSMFFLFCPWTTDTMMTTEATPMIMPSIVRKERIFLDAMDLKAILNACIRFTASPPPGACRI